MSLAVHAHGPRAMRALVVDDDPQARTGLSALLHSDARIGTVHTSADAGQALRILADEQVDVVFCEIRLRGLDGVEFARVLGRFADPPQIVFVTGDGERAVEAFDLHATDYLLKPVRPERLAETVRRAVLLGEARPTEDETIAVELAGVTRFVRRSQVRYVEADGDYARLHTATGSHLVRCTLAELEDRWAGAGFVRSHRHTLVALSHVDEVSQVDGHCAVVLGADRLPVSRRHTRELRERLLGH